MDFMSIVENSLQQAFGPTAVIYCLAAIGLNVHFGYTGLLNFGQAGFMMVAGYALGGAVTIYSSSLWIGAIVGVLLCVLLALLLGVPTLRLRADYLAIVTIAAAEIIRQTIGAAAFSDTFGGQDGITDFISGFRALNPYSEGFWVWSAYDFWVMTVGWVLVAICCVIVWLLMRSPWGRVLKGIREDEYAVRSLGKNVYSYKMQALIIGGVIGGFAGMMTSLRSAAVGPSFFATDVTFFAYTALLIGGAARVLGPVVGSIIFWFLISFFGSFFSQATSGPDPLIPSWIMDPNQASVMRFILVGLGLMLLMIFRPQGIFGDRRELAIDAR
ncbi:branched-chain amino acid ABC transporter permease [Nocardioides sp. GXQ0305]|uniref:branched-chain amino acid ABC transporter permease n=1 Tax=Nocardioides sp. GXQ0305 TaxID=3423912 RepID=UPI003D7C925C